MATIYNYTLLGMTPIRAKRPERRFTHFTIDRVKPAPFLPVSLETITDQSRMDIPIVPGTVTEQDTLMNIYIGAAVEWLEWHLCQPILRTSWIQRQDTLTTLPEGRVRNLLGISLRRALFPGSTPVVKYFLQGDPTTELTLASSSYYVTGNSIVIKEDNERNLLYREVAGLEIQFDAGYVGWASYPSLTPSQSEIDAARLKVKPEDIFSVASLVSLMDTQREGSQDDIKYQATAKLQGLTPAQIQMVLGHRKPATVTGSIFGGRVGQ